MGKKVMVDRKLVFHFTGTCAATAIFYNIAPAPWNLVVGIIGGILILVTGVALKKAMKI